METAIGGKGNGREGNEGEEREGRKRWGWNLGGKFESLALGAILGVSDVTVPGDPRYLTKLFPFCTGAGTIFRLGDQKLVKNQSDSQIQNITLCKEIDLRIFRKMLGRFREFLC